MKCKICKSKIHQIIDFGPMPIANGFVADISKDKYRFDLSLNFCPNCYMVQIGEVVKPTLMFNDQYHFLSSTSQAMEKHFKNVADEIIKKVKGKNNPFVIEIGSNDGIMLKHIAAKRIRQLGIEPSGNVAAMSKKYGVVAIEEFFNQTTAKKIVKNHGKANMIFGANVICHIEDINAVFEGISLVLKDDGVFFFEEPYIYDIVKKASFDQVYDEHIYFYSGLSVRELAKRHNLQLVDMQHQDVHGGSMRYYIVKGKKNKETNRMRAYIAKEKALGLHMLKGYMNFKQKVNKICDDLRNLLLKLSKKGKVAAYGATSKSTTLLNYARIGANSIAYISDTTPTKINKFTPGTHIPVKPYEYFKKNSPKYSVLLAWNHKKEIFEKEKDYRKKGGKFITFFPKVKIE